MIPGLARVQIPSLPPRCCLLSGGRCLRSSIASNSGAESKLRGCKDAMRTDPASHHVRLARAHFRTELERGAPIRRPGDLSNARRSSLDALDSQSSPRSPLVVEVFGEAPSCLMRLQTLLLAQRPVTRWKRGDISNVATSLRRGRIRIGEPC